MQQPKQEISSAWNQYWQGDKSGHAYTDQGESQPAIQEFWNRQFSPLFEAQSSISMIDLACGNGSLSQLANSLKKNCHIDQTCLDVSSAALDNVKAQLPGITPVLSNMQPIELPDQSFDLVVSQFGVEYAGLSAFGEARKLVKPQGKAIFVIHVTGSVIEQESGANHDAIAQFIDSEFIRHTKNLLKAGFKALKSGSPDHRALFKQLAIPFNSALQKVETILESYGVDITAGTILRLYNDIANVVENMGKYDQDEISAWLDGMHGELTTYRTRMASMVNAALDDEEFQTLQDQFTHDGFTVEAAATLIDTNNEQLLAWAFVAQRQ